MISDLWRSFTGIYFIKLELSQYSHLSSFPRETPLHQKVVVLFFVFSAGGQSSANIFSVHIDGEAESWAIPFEFSVDGVSDTEIFSSYAFNVAGYSTTRLVSPHTRVIVLDRIVRGRVLGQGDPVNFDADVNAGQLFVDCHLQS